MLHRDKDPDRRLATLIKLGAAYKSGKDRDSSKYALNQQDLAQAMMEVRPPQASDAIRNLQEALDYWRGPGNGKPLQLEGLIGDLLDDLLKSGQYTEATAFAAKQIATKPEYQQIVGPRIKDQAFELSSDAPPDRGQDTDRCRRWR